MKKIISLVLCFVLVLSLAACGGTTETTEFTPVSDGDVVGEGSASFPLTIVDRDGNAISITVNTDAETVGQALLDNGIVEGEEGDYGLYIHSVNGIRAVYEEDATYWAFYVNDAYAMTGVDMTPIAEGESYMLKVES